MTGSARDESRPAAAGPETVRVVRPGHPLHGLDLPVWGRLRPRGVAMVVLVLPDGSKKRIPAAWAREDGSEDTGAPAAAVVAAAGVAGFPLPPSPAQAAGMRFLLPSGSTRTTMATPRSRSRPQTGRSRPCRGCPGRTTRTISGPAPAGGDSQCALPVTAGSRE